MSRKSDQKEDSAQRNTIMNGALEKTGDRSDRMADGIKSILIRQLERDFTAAQLAASNTANVKPLLDMLTSEDPAISLLSLRTIILDFTGSLERIKALTLENLAIFNPKPSDDYVRERITLYTSLLVARAAPLMGAYKKVCLEAGLGEPKSFQDFSVAKDNSSN